MLAWERSSVLLLMLTLMASIHTLSAECRQNNNNLCMKGRREGGKEGRRRRQWEREGTGCILPTNVVCFIKDNYSLLRELLGDHLSNLGVQ